LDAVALGRIETVISGFHVERAGLRLFGIAALDPYLRIDGAIGAIAGSALGVKAKPVRALLFDKTPHSNWKVGWHQDRTIAVRGRVAVEGYGPWATKDGVQHVEPPFDLLADMVTLRLHLDDVGAGNSPLLIAPGSHRFGRIAQRDVRSVVEKCGTCSCLADAGDVWLYATPIVHASDAAASPARRRVLQIDYCARELPGGLEWLGVRNRDQAERVPPWSALHYARCVPCSFVTHFNTCVATATKVPS
jgi:hypothetical protein